MEKIEIMKFIVVTVLLLMLFTVLPANAEDECRNELPAYLKPISDNSSLYWALEFTGALGTGTSLSSSLFTRDSLFMAFEWKPSETFSIYIEGGWRYYNTGFDETEEEPLTLIYEGNRNRNDDGELFCCATAEMFFKLKQAFFEYKKDRFAFSGGLRIIKSDDGFLLNERLYGGLLSISRVHSSSKPMLDLLYDYLHMVIKHGYSSL